MLWLGLVSALAASIMFNVGIVLQALDARAAPRALALKLALLGRLLARPRWVLGFMLGLVGIGPQILAYANAPFVIVQPVLSLGLLLVLALGVRVLGERVTVREVVGVIAIIAGVVLVAWGAPAHAETHRMGAAVIVVVAALSALGIAPFVLRWTRLDLGLVTMVAAGCGFGATNVATKLLGDDFNLGHYANAVTWGIVGLAMGVVATLTNMTAFQLRAATTVVPVSTAVQTFLPIVLEPFFLRERWGSAIYDGVPMAGGLVVALIGGVLIAGSTAVSEMVADAT